MHAPVKDAISRSALVVVVRGGRVGGKLVGQLTELQQVISAPTVLRFHSTRRMSSTYERETVTFLLSVGLRDPKAAQAWGLPQQPQWELQRQGDRLADASHPDGPTAGGQGGCGKVPSSGTASTGDTAAGQHGTGRCGPETGGGRLLRPDLHGPVLLNRSNVCYINWCCHLLRWLGLGHDPHSSVVPGAPKCPGRLGG